MSVALFAVALVLRVAVAAWQGLSAPLPAQGDDVEYVTYATSLATTGEYRGMSPDIADQNHVTAYRTPGTSLVYAAIFKVFGVHLAPLRLFNCLWGAVACVLLLAIGREVTTETVASIAAWIWAVYPRALLFSGTLYSESLGLMVFLAFLLGALRFARKPSGTGALVTGALLGVAILVHPARLFVVPVFGLWALVVFRRDRRSMAWALAILVIGALVVLPWPIRNYRVFHKFIPLSTSGGSALLQGNNRVVVTDPAYYGYSVWDSFLPEYADSLKQAGNEFDRDKVAGRFAKDWIKANPQHWAFLVKAKLVRGFTPLLQANTARMYRVLELVCWGPVLILLVIGFVPTWRQLARERSPGWLLHLTVLHFVMITVLFFGNSRYRYSVEAICILIAAMMAARLLAWGRSRQAVAPSTG